MPMACPQCGAALPAIGTGERTLTFCPSCDAPLDVMDLADTACERPDDQAAQTRWTSLVTPNTHADDTLRPPEQLAPARSGVTVKPHTVSPLDEATAESDYVILEPIGEGGMGIVAAARQTCLDRTIALKMLRPGASSGARAREQFLAEAAVTGELDHPNIVPVYDLGSSVDGQLFYSMKLVRGQPWSQVLATLSTEANVDILLKVCDAVAFAHAHGVVHRDLKPHNIMLGDYGEVLLMDWGVAASIGEGAKAEPLRNASAIAGTASYMAPEMALGQTRRIGPASDVYLLGAMLFQIVTGTAPHPGDDVMERLQAAADNLIRDPGQPDELVDIALRAMSTDPAERQPSVKAFQAELRECQAHAESRTLSDRAFASLVEAEEGAGYDAYSRAVFGFGEALALWPDNPGAARGLDSARHAYARRALARQDLDLAESLLAGSAADAELLERIADARRRRDARAHRVQILSRTAAALAVAVVLIFAVSYVLVVGQRNRARRAETTAAEQRNIALETLETLVFEVDQELANRPAMARLRQTLLDQAIDGLNRVTRTVDQGRQVDANLAEAHESMAQIFHAARRNDEARAHQERAIALYSGLGETSPSNQAKLVLASAHITMGDIVHNHRMGDLEASRRWYSQALTMIEQLRVAAPDDNEIMSQLAIVLRDLGDTSIDLGLISEAEAYYERTRAVCRELVAAHPDQIKPRQWLLDALSRLGDTRYEAEAWADARALYTEALTLGLALAGEHPDNDECLRQAALAHLNLGLVDWEMDQQASAVRNLEAAVELHRELFERDSTNVQYQRDLFAARYTMARLVATEERWDEALARFQEAMVIAERLFTLNPDSAEAKRDLLVCAWRIGDMHLEMEQTDDAEVIFQRALGLAQELVEASPDRTEAHTDLVVCLTKLAAVEKARGRCPEQLSLGEQELAILHRLYQDGRFSQDSEYYDWFDEIEQEMAVCRQ